MLESKKDMYESEEIFRPPYSTMHNAQRSNQPITANGTAYGAYHTSALLFTATSLQFTDTQDTSRIRMAVSWKMPTNKISILRFQRVQYNFCPGIHIFAFAEIQWKPAVGTLQVWYSKLTSFTQD